MRVFNVLFMALLLTCSGFAEVEQLKRLPENSFHQGEEQSFSPGKGNSQTVSEGWMDSIEAAQKVAEERDCPLLIAFLGPNWCSFSDTLEEEILSQKAFTQFLGQEMVLVKIDIPEDFEERNYYGKDLKETYHVDECPCLVLADSNAHAIAKLDYLPVTCEHFVRYVKQIMGDYERVSQLARSELRQMKVDELKHLYARAGRLADTTFKKVLMKQGLKVDRGPYFLVEEYGNMLASGAASERKLKRIRNKVLARDPKNEQGCLRKLALIDFERKVGPRTPEQVIEPLLSYLRQFGPEDAENAWKLEMKISQYLFSKNQIEGALKHARLSLDQAPPEAKQEIAQSIEYLQSFVQ